MKDSYKIITDPSLIDRDAWSDFVRDHPKGNIFQTPEFYDLGIKTNANDVIFICCKRNDEIKGLLLAMIQKENSGFIGKLTARSIIIGGPLVSEDNYDVFTLIIESYKIIAGKLALFSQVRNLSDISSVHTVFIQAGFRYEDHLNILINLSSDIQHLWSEIHPTRRKQINRSRRRDVTARMIEYPDDDILTACFNLLGRVYRKAGLPLQSKQFFLEAARILGQKQYIRLFVALYQDQLIGFRLVLCYKGTIYDWYAASSEDHLEKYPNDLLPWSIMEWGQQNGYLQFDFGGAGKPGVSYGVRDYKLKFGGELVNYGRYLLIHKRVNYFLIMMLYNIRKAFKKGI